MDFESRIIIVVVLYQLPIPESTTLQCLREYLVGVKNCTILVYDNGADDQLEVCHIFLPQHSFTAIYYHNPANPGVAAAYNFGGQLAHRQQATHLVIFDQDTTLPLDYFEEIARLQCQPGQPPLWMPQVLIDKNRMVSPNRFWLGRFWSIAPGTLSSGIAPARQLSAINSGLVIDMSAFDRLQGYDESFPLDLSDHVFLYHYRQQYSTLYIMQSKLRHSLSVAGRTDMTSALRRFDIQRRASLLFSKQTGNYLNFFWCMVFGVRLCIRYRSVAFLNPFRNSSS